MRLAEGGSLRVGYAASNGHPATMIGRILVERGELTKEAATMQTVRQWLRDQAWQSVPYAHWELTQERAALVRTHVSAEIP